MLLSSAPEAWRDIWWKAAAQEVRRRGKKVPERQEIRWLWEERSNKSARVGVDRDAGSEIVYCSAGAKQNGREQRQKKRMRSHLKRAVFLSVKH